MNEIYIKASDLGESLVERAEKHTPISNGDILSIGDLVDIIDELLYKIEKLEEDLDEYKNPEEYRPTFDYSEWKANQE